MNLAELVAGHDGHGRAIHDAEGWHTWDDVRRQAAATAAALVDAGVGPGDRVVVAWPASAGFVATYLGILASGAVAVPVNPFDPPTALASELAAVDPVVAIGVGPGVGALDAAVAALDPAPAGRAAPAVLSSGRGAGTWDEALEAVGATAPAYRPVPRRPDDVAVLLFTSGTAGTPKPAMLTHGSLGANLRQLLAAPKVAARPDDVGCCTLPLFHVFGLNVALGLSLATGSPLVVMERFAAEEAAELIAAVGATVVVGAPAAFAHWLHVAAGHAGNGRHPSPWSTVRLAVAGGAPVPAQLAVDFEALSGVPLHQGYGLTEASPAVAATLGQGRPRPGSAGRVLPGVEVRLVDEDGDLALAGDPGEIWVRGPNVFAGYWRDQRATQAVLGADGWLRTGDIGVASPDGELWVVDRAKDLVIVSGFNVYPAEVEAVLRTAPGVAEAVVVGRPDPVAGEVVEAVVVPQAGRQLDDSAVMAHCMQHLPRYKCPVAVRVVERLPRGESGEALRRRLRGGLSDPSV
jgi:long-chain acyl-CoA synthetase